MLTAPLINEYFGVGVMSEPWMASAGVEPRMGSSTDKHLSRSTTYATANQPVATKQNNYNSTVCGLPVRAKQYTSTRAAPCLTNNPLIIEQVVPVVRTSSTNTTCLSLTCSGRVI